MASGSYQQVYVRCPFYKQDDGKQRIVCEGIVDGCSLSLTYMRKTDFQIQMSAFCCEHYEKCEVYRMLMDKYED